MFRQLDLCVCVKMDGVVFTSLAKMSKKSSSVVSGYTDGKTFAFKMLVVSV